MPAEHLCASCGAKFWWYRTVNGKMLPVDIEPCQDGNIVLHDGIAHVVKDMFDGGPFYASHFATCPGAAAHRKPRKEP